jgi:hypothetical protein
MLALGNISGSAADAFHSKQPISTPAGSIWLCRNYLPVLFFLLL